MMKVLGSCVVFTIICVASAGFFTPTSEKHISNDAGNTKVSVSPTDNNGDEHVTTNAKLSKNMEGIKEPTSSDQANKQPEAVSDKATQAAKESVKDAASGLSSKAKGKVAEKASEMKQGAKEQAERKVEEAKEKAEELVGTAKQRVMGFLRRVINYVMSPVRMLLSSVAGVLHLLGFAVAYGMCVWVTFASSYVLAGALPGLQFAMVQSKIYPVYFKAMACSVGMALLGYLMSRPGMFGGFDLMASLAMILVNLFYLEPRTTKVMFERMKKEKEEGTGKEGQVSEPAVDVTTETAAAGTREEGSKERQEEAAKPRIVRSRGILLRRLNSNSSVLNVVTLMSLTWHLVHLAHNLHAAC